MTVNENSTTLNTTLAIYDIKLAGHRPQGAKRSVSLSNPGVLTWEMDPTGHKIFFNMIYGLKMNLFMNLFTTNSRVQDVVLRTDPYLNAVLSTQVKALDEQK